MDEEGLRTGLLCRDAQGVVIGRRWAGLGHRGVQCERGTGWARANAAPRALNCFAVYFRLN